MPSLARRFSAGPAVARGFVLLLFLLQLSSGAQQRAAIAGSAAGRTVDAAALAALPVSQMLPHMQLELKRSTAQQAALVNYLRDVQTPGSGQYRQWMTPELFAEKFAPASASAVAARQWLQQEGFQVGATSGNGMRIAFSGSALQVNRSFATTLRRSAGADGAATLVAPEMSVPAALADVVAGVTGVVLQADAATVLADTVDANTQAIVVLPADAQAVGGDSLTELLLQAAAQGITVLATNGDGSMADAAVLLPAAATGAATAEANAAARPWWQQADGLPGDGLRAVPDAVVTDSAALVTGLQGLVASRGTRLGELAPALYRLRMGHGLFTHADASEAAGSWTATDGLGTLNVKSLLQALAVGTQGSNVALTTSSYSLTHGQSLSVTLVVTGGSGTPTGSVTATLKGRATGTAVTLGPSSLTSGAATSSTATLPGDVYDVTGSYSGDATYNTNTSNTATVTVLPENAVVTATAPASTPLGSNIPITVTVSSASGVGAPTGTVTVYPYGTSIASTTYTGTLPASTTGSASVVVQVPATDSGTFTFQATCTSSGSFSCSTPVSFAVTEGKPVPGVVLTATQTGATGTTSLATATRAGTAAVTDVVNSTNYTIAATVTAPAGSGSTAAVPTGTVQVMNGTTVLGSITLSKGTGTTTAALTGTSNTLTGVYSGDTNYATATSAAVTVTSAAAPTTNITTVTTITTGVSQTTAGSTVPLTASVTPTNYAAEGAPTGTITFTSSLQGVIGVAVLSNGYVTYNATNLIVGSHVITAAFSPATSTYAASTSNPGVAVAVGASTVKVITSTTLTVSPSAPVIGGTVTLTAQITPVATVGAGTPTTAPTGTVSFYANDVLIATAAVTGGSTGGVSVTATAKLPIANVIYFRATYSGDNVYAGSSSVGFPVTLALATPSIVLTSSTTQTNAGSTIVLTATLGAGTSTSTAVPSGSIAFYDTYNGSVLTLGSATLLSNGVNASVATLSVTGLQAGVHVISAVYNGDTNFVAATSNLVSVNFGDFALAFSPQSLTLSRGGTGTATATLTSRFGFGGAVLLTCTPPASSQITCSLAPSTLYTSGQSILTVTTAGATAKLERPRMGGHGGAALGSGAVLAGVLGLLLPRRRRTIAGLLVLVAMAVVTSGGCGLGVVDQTQNSNGGTTTPVNGGGGSGSGTPYGTYALTITAASGDTTLRHTYSYQVTVQ